MVKNSEVWFRVVCNTNVNWHVLNVELFASLLRIIQAFHIVCCRVFMAPFTPNALCWQWLFITHGHIVVGIICKLVLMFPLCFGEYVI